MATPLLIPAFATGEIAPSVWGRVDIDKERIAATTLRNAFVAYRGGINSRAGTMFVGFSKQTGRLFPPRLIPFQFSINQGLALEFGDFYMRVVDKGAYVTETPVAIGGATNANPAVLTFGTEGASAATPNNGAVTFSYAPGDLVTLMGGTALTPAVLEVTTSELVSILPNAHGTGYAVNDTVTLAGGTFTTAAIAKVASAAAYAAAGSVSFTTNPSDGDTVTLNSVAWTFKTTATTTAQTQIQSTLAGTLNQLASDLNASANSSLTVATYSSNDTQLLVVDDTPGTGGNAYTLAASVGIPSSATLTGGTTNGIATLTINTAGVFTALPANAQMTQSASSGGGSGATFQTAVFGPHALTVSNPGAYTVTPGNPVSQAATTGIGVGATFTVTWAAVPAFSNGDSIEVASVEGMTELNGNTYVLGGVTATTAELFDVYGDAVDSTGYGAYTGSGTAARIYTLDTPYSEADLAWLKYAESADEMTLCCVNQLTGVEYAPQNLSRFSDTNWVFSDVVAEPSVGAPTNLTASISGTGTTFYQYVVTATSPIDGTESIMSAIASIKGVSISTQQGQVSLSWLPVAGVQEYNVYKAQPSFGSQVPVGSLFGYIGSAYGTKFNDTNILPDFAEVPPKHENPFARGQIAGVNIVTGGSGYTTASAVITSGTGSGASIEMIVQNGAVVGVVIDDAGEGYEAGDTIAITGSGGTGATATLIIGPETGTYPSVPGYFQERRVFANSLNEPDTYWMSQPGAFENFDVRIPPIDTDAITGSPWAVQVNGLQFLVQTTGGLLVMTGLSAWLLVGAGSFATNVQPISPSSQDVNPQPFTGCSPTVMPIKINYDVIYVTAKGSLYYDLPYQLYALSEPLDLTEYAAHLFEDHTIVCHAWCEQPSKVLWSIRDDGVMLSLTYLKAEQIVGWARHDTNGLFVSNCSVTEPPVDALYVATKRYIGDKTAYMIERMDDRLWQSVEQVWAVDAALSLPQDQPQATLTADSAYGVGNLTGVINLIGGGSYSAGTVATVVDDDGNGPGVGAVPVLTIVAGVITDVDFAPQGGGYVNPRLVISDPAGSGSGASASIVLNTAAQFTASAAIFSADDVGSVIRMGGGIATITAFQNPQRVTGFLSSPITAVRPNSGGMIQPQDPGTWTLTAPVTQVDGLGYLAGATVTGLADGNIITPRVVSPTGSIILDAPASSIVVGLGFQAQFQSVYAEGGAPTMQGQRKKIGAVSALVKSSLGIKMGVNQVDGSTLNPPQEAVVWNSLDSIPDRGLQGQPRRPYNSAVDQLYTSYVRIPVSSGFNKTGQVALQQDNPLPMDIIALVPELLSGDIPEQMAQQPKGRGK